jgi:hypothetical protein
MTIISIKIKLSSGNLDWRDIISPQTKIKKTPGVRRIQRTIKCDSKFYFGGS